MTKPAKKLVAQLTELVINASLKQTFLNDQYVNAKRVRLLTNKRYCEIYCS